MSQKSTYKKKMWRKSAKRLSWTSCSRTPLITRKPTSGSRGIFCKNRPKKVGFGWWPFCLAKALSSISLVMAWFTRVLSGASGIFWRNSRGSPRLGNSKRDKSRSSNLHHVAQWTVLHIPPMCEWSICFFKQFLVFYVRINLSPACCAWSAARHEAATCQSTLC